MPRGRALLAALVLGLAGCTLASERSPATTDLSKQTGVAAEQGTAAPASVGGTVRVLADQRIPTWDPQRMGLGPEAAIALRTFTRTLTGYPAGGVGGAGGLTGDLATDTGRESDGGRTWTFTLRAGPTWEDGTPVTCEHVRYGVSRAFARATLPGGLPYPVTLLDVPSVPDPRGAPTPGYEGPYTGVGQPAFDRAVSCVGSELTFRLKGPVHDFPYVVALPAFAPYRPDRDRRADGNYDVFSCGPYRLERGWEQGSGGRFVRNPAWSRDTDPLRPALVDVVDIRDGIGTDALLRRIVEDKRPDDTAIALLDVPPSRQQSLLADPTVAARVATVPSGTVEMLQLNVRSPVLAKPEVRRAFAMATDRQAFAAAYGVSAVVPAYAALAADVPGHHATSPLDTPVSGDPEAARAMLTAAGVGQPVPVTIAYRASPSADAAFVALETRWEQAGFAVTLAPIAGDYHATISAPGAAARYDAFRTSWFADYPSGSAVIPLLFDGRANLGESGSGLDVGLFDDPEVNAAIDRTYGTADRGARDRAWSELDAVLARTGAHVALGERRRFFVRGSGVTSFAVHPYLGAWPDLAGITVRG